MRSGLRGGREVSRYGGMVIRWRRAIGEFDEKLRIPSGNVSTYAARGRLPFEWCASLAKAIPLVGKIRFQTSR